LTSYAAEIDLFDGIATQARLPLAFLAISYAPGVQPAQRSPGGEDRILAAAALLTDECPLTIGDETRVWLHGHEPWIMSSPNGSFMALLSRSPDPLGLTTRLGRLLMTGQPRLGQAAAEVLSGITPPFGVVSCSGPGRPVIAATDLTGSRHLYWYQGDGWAGLSTSALALACCAGTGPDADALVVRAMLGFHLGTSSPFHGVHKLGPAEAAALTAGRVQTARYATPWPTQDRQKLTAAAVADTLAGLLRACGEWTSATFPAAVLELSGGLDSRILLAAIPRSDRGRLRALTLDTAGADTVIARQLAAATGLDHQVLPLAGLSALTPEQAWAIVARSAVRDDCSANPVSHGVLDWAEQHARTGPRIQGAGGEIARGFYYLGQRQHRRATAALASRLARWRLMTNEAVDPRCMGADVAGWARAACVHEVTQLLTGYRSNWLAATDEFYARERVARWAGVRLSAASTEQTILSPLLHPDFVSIARACPPAVKRNSRLMAMVLARLDPELARLPLDSGIPPVRLAAPGVLGHARNAPFTGKKTLRKVRQRLSGAGRPGLGQPALSALVVAHWRSEPHLLAGIAATGLADAAWVDQLLDGGCDADPATVGYLANLAVMTQALAVRPRPPRCWPGGHSAGPGRSRTPWPEPPRWRPARRTGARATQTAGTGGPRPGMS
jgi:asparagine synthase (glutamine-hydrolysing)